jgi:glycosyltransferase involved in cell wall biosynthesis
VNPPLVSVLLASRDGARWLGAALDSLAAQHYGPIEIVAVDDGSRDATGDMLRAFAARHGRTRVLPSGGIGLAGALALAAREATGDLFARQDDDDVSDPERIARQVARLSADPGLAVVGTAAHVIDPAGRTVGETRMPTEPGAIRRMLRRAPPFVHGSVVMRRAAYEAAGGYRAAFGASQDYDLWLRMPGSAGLANLEAPLYAWRAHPGGVFARARGRQLFFAALARTFADERAEQGHDAYEVLVTAPDVDAFIEHYPRAAALLVDWGERLVREGRVAEARHKLAQALARGAGARAAAWWLASLGVACMPRARRAAAAVRAESSAPSPRVDQERRA